MHGGGSELVDHIHVSASHAAKLMVTYKDEDDEVCMITGSWLIWLRQLRREKRETKGVH